MDYDYSTFVMIACGLAFVVITRAHLSGITARATATRMAIAAEIATRSAQEPTPILKPSAILKARPPAAARPITIKPKPTPGSSHAA